MQPVDELLPHPPPLGRRVERRRDLHGGHHAVDLLHHVERRPDHRRIGAHGQHPRDPRPPGQRFEHPRLAQHVVGARRQRRTRWPAHDEPPGAPADEVGDVRVAVADRRELRLALPQPVAVEEGDEPVDDDQRRPPRRRRRPSRRCRPPPPPAPSAEIPRRRRRPHRRRIPRRYRPPHQPRSPVAARVEAPARASFRHSRAIVIRWTSLAPS